MGFGFQSVISQIWVLLITEHFVFSAFVVLKVHWKQFLRTLKARSCCFVLNPPLELVLNSVCKGSKATPKIIGFTCNTAILKYCFTEINFCSPLARAVKCWAPRLMLCQLEMVKLAPRSVVLDPPDNLSQKYVHPIH